MAPRLDECLAKNKLKPLAFQPSLEATLRATRYNDRHVSLSDRPRVNCKCLITAKPMQLNS